MDDDGLEKPFLGPENFSTKDIDRLESLPLEDVFEQLSTSRGGLSSADAAERLQLFGPNRLEEKRENKVLKFMGFMWNPLSWVMEAAAIMALVLANGGVLTCIGNFCICSIAAGVIVEVIVMFAVQHRSYRDGINNVLVLLIGGIPIAMPTVLSVTLAVGSHHLSQQGAITKRMTAIEEMAGMDVLCCDKTGTLTLNHLIVDKNLIEVFSGGMDRDMIILLAARASRVDNQDAVDMAIINMLGDPKEARANITEVHFLPFNPVDKRTAITYIDSGGNWFRVSKGAPEQILDLCYNKQDDDIAEKAQRGVDRFLSWLTA